MVRRGQECTDCTGSMENNDAHWSLTFMVDTVTTSNDGSFALSK